MILPLPILYGVYCNKEGSGGNNVSRNRVGNKVGEWGAQPKGVFAQNMIDSCTNSLRSKNIFSKGQIVLVTHHFGSSCFGGVERGDGDGGRWKDHAEGAHAGEGENGR